MIGRQATTQHPVRHKSPARRSRKVLVAAIAGVLAMAAAVGWLILRGGSGPAVSPEALAEQMEAAARGGTSGLNLYGGALVVDHSAGTVIVDGLPPSVCVSMGWKLVRKGLVSINGVMPVRVSAAKLSELCNVYDTAAVVWTPRQPD
jgi:hypothetical protein